MQINLTGFLTKSTPAFMDALWSLLIEAQESPAGIPKTFVDEKKEEMRKAKEGDTRAFDERDRRVRLDDIRDREREGGRGRGRGGGRGRGRGRGGYDDNRPGRGWGNRGGGGGGPGVSSSLLSYKGVSINPTVAETTIFLKVSTAKASFARETFSFQH